MNAALRDLDAGLPIASERQSVEQFLRSWLEMIKPSIEESTWERHRQFCALHIIPKIGRVKLAALTPQLGRPLIKGNVYRSFLRLLNRARLPQARFHDLRHTCATLLLVARVNPKVVSEMLGHASVSITLDIYSHVIPDMQKDAAAIMAGVLQLDEGDM